MAVAITLEIDAVLEIYRKVISIRKPEDVFVLGFSVDEVMSSHFWHTIESSINLHRSIRKYLVSGVSTVTVSGNDITTLNGLIELIEINKARGITL